MAANPTMTYTEQHAQALLIPKVTDVGTATRDPDALRAFIHLFRDVQIPDDVQEDAASREANVEAFYLADEPDEIKEVSIHLATVLSALAANTNAGYQAHATYGAELRNSILYRCSLVFDYALIGDGLELQRAKVAFNTFNSASPVFADMTDDDQITDALSAQRETLQAQLETELAQDDDDLHESTLIQSAFLSPILSADTFVNTQDLLREVCSYLALHFSITFSVSNSDADTQLTELLTMAGFKNTDTPLAADSSRFQAVHTIAVRLVVRQRKLFHSKSIIYPKTSKIVDQLASTYRCKHEGAPIDKNTATRLLANAVGLYSSASSELPLDHHFFLIAYFKHQGAKDPMLRKGASLILHGSAATLSPQAFVQALAIPPRPSDSATPISASGALRDRALATNGFDPTSVVPATLAFIPINNVRMEDLTPSNQRQWIGARLLDSKGRIGRVTAVNKPPGSATLSPPTGKLTTFYVMFVDEQEILTAEAVNQLHVAFVSCQTQSLLEGADNSDGFASALAQVPTLTLFPEHDHRHGQVPKARVIDSIAASIRCHTNPNSANIAKDQFTAEQLAMNKDQCAADYANNVVDFVNQFTSRSGKELSILEGARPAAYAQLEATLFHARDALGTQVHHVRDVDLLNLMRFQYEKVDWIYFQPVTDAALADEIASNSSSAAKKGAKPPSFTDCFMGYTRFQSAIATAYKMLDAAKMLSTRQREGWTWLMGIIERFHCQRNLYCEPRDVYHWFRIRLRILTREIKSCLMHGVSPLDYPNFEHISDIDGEDKIAFEALKSIKQQRRLMSRVLDEYEKESPAKKSRSTSDADTTAIKKELAALRKSNSSLRKSLGKGGQLLITDGSEATDEHSDKRAKDSKKAKGKGKGDKTETPGKTERQERYDQFNLWRDAEGLDEQGRNRCWNFSHDKACADNPCPHSHEAAAADQQAARAAKT